MNILTIVGLTYLLVFGVPSLYAVLKEKLEEHSETIKLVLMVLVTFIVLVVLWNVLDQQGLNWTDNHYAY